MYKVCNYCKKGFETPKYNKLFCSDECYKAAKRIKDRNRERIRTGIPLTSRVCPICNKAFDITGRATKYCSAECAKKGKALHRKKRREEAK